MSSTPSRATQIEHQFTVVCNKDEHGQGLKEMIEFLDILPVRISRPGSWLDDLGECQSVAVFLTDDLESSDVESIVDLVAQKHANTPIVRIVDDSGLESFVAKNNSASPISYALSSPVSFDALASILDEAWSIRRRKRRPGSDEEATSDLIGDSKALNDIRALIGHVAPTDSTVLLNGESGTGKEVIARRIHEQSGRKGRFVAVNCGAIPDHLLETELFGHERGAFTGAEAARTGRFEWAEGGTLFLDEIGDMPKALQVKLLRVLQERVIERIGGSTETPVDIRLVAATHRDLSKWIEQGRFREDLFYRLSVFPIDIPPLRERKDDIPPLIDEFVDRVRQNYGVSLAFSNDALERLRNYAWPGNVRELANLIERLAVSHSGSVIEAGDLPWPIGSESEASDASESGGAPSLPAGGINLRDYLSDVERRAIEDALSESNGVVQQAADRLGMGRTTLVEKIKRYGISS